MIESRPYQTTAVQHCATHRRASVKAAAAAGKTVIAALALKRVLEAKPRTEPVKAGWLCNTREQAQQAFKAMVEVFYGVPADAPEAEAVWERENRRAGRPLLLRVACAAAATDWSDRDVLVVDECHHATADGWRTQIETCQGARWGFTATPPEDPDDLEVFCGLFGGEPFEVEREHVQHKLAAARVVLLEASDRDARQSIEADIERRMKASGRLRWFLADKNTPAIMKRLFGDSQRTRKSLSMAEGTRFDALLDKTIHGIIFSRASWQACVDYGIVQNMTRSVVAHQTATAHVNSGDSVLVLVNQIAHGKELARHIPGAETCSSKLPAKARRDMLERFKDGRLKCLVATSLADEGLDVPRANVLVLVSAGRSSRLAEQRTGRVMRQFAGKAEGLVYDFEDKFHPTMARHSQKRQVVYRKLGYAFSKTQIDD